MTETTETETTDDGSWRRGDESTESTTMCGRTIPAETEGDYKGILKPDEFQSWSNEQRAAWRLGVEASIDMAARGTAVALCIMLGP